MDVSATVTPNHRYVELQLIDAALNITAMLTYDEAGVLVREIGEAQGKIAAHNRYEERNGPTK
jgi:hypothetical protein